MLSLKSHHNTTQLLCWSKALLLGYFNNALTLGSIFCICVVLYFVCCLLIFFSLASNYNFFCGLNMQPIPLNYHKTSLIILVITYRALSFIWSKEHRNVNLQITYLSNMMPTWRVGLDLLWHLALVVGQLSPLLVSNNLNYWGWLLKDSHAQKKLSDRD